MVLAYTTFGPFFKVTCTPADLAAPTEADLVGVLEARCSQLLSCCAHRHG